MGLQQPLHCTVLSSQKPKARCIILRGGWKTVGLVSNVKTQTKVSSNKKYLIETMGKPQALPQQQDRWLEVNTTDISTHQQWPSPEAQR